MSDGLAPKRFARARQEFWQAVQKRASSRQAMALAFTAAGFEVTESAVGRWVRGESDPGFETTAWASERWGVSLDEHVSGKALATTVSEQLAQLRAEQRDQGRLVARLNAALDLLAERTRQEGIFDEIDSREPEPLPRAQEA